MTRIAALILSLTLLGATARAAALKADTQEFRASGQFDPSSVAGSSFATEITYGYFILDDLEVGGQIAYRHDDDSSLFSAGPFVEYNFDLEREIVPFVGLALNLASADAHEESRSAAELTAYAGGRYFLTENIALGARIEFSAATDKIYANDNSADDAEVTVIFGMSYYIGP